MKKMKKFFTLDCRHADGFTLVELIVVIAIMAILGGVGVPAYSGYIEKTNIGADQALIGDIIHAINLEFYANPAFQDGSVTVSTTGTSVGGNSFLESAMEKAFGEGWKDLRLKYDGYENSHADAVDKLNNSSFSNGEGGVKQGLLGTVDNLTGTLSGLMQHPAFSIGNYGGFADYLNENGINYATDPQKAANSIVPYLSDATAGADRDKVKEALSTADSWIVTDDAGNQKLSMTAALGSTVSNAGTNPFASLAVTYATMKGFCEWADTQDAGNGVSISELFDSIPLDTYRDAEGHDQPVLHEPHVVEAIQQALESEGYASQMAPLFEQYISSGSAAKDVDAYFGVIDSIADNKDYIMENLDNSENFYADRAGYLNTYLSVDVESGEVAVFANRLPDGTLNVGSMGMGTGS